MLSDSALSESALESRSLSAWGLAMRRFIDGEDRMQPALLPHCLEDYVDEENPVRVIEVFIDELDLSALGFLRNIYAGEDASWRTKPRLLARRRRFARTRALYLSS